MMCRVEMRIDNSTRAENLVTVLTYQRRAAAFWLKFHILRVL